MRRWRIDNTPDPVPSTSHPAWRRRSTSCSSSGPARRRRRSRRWGRRRGRSRGSASRSPSSSCCARLGTKQWDLDAIPANRRRALAQYVRRATSQAIGRRDRTFRDPALLAFCAEAAARVTDEIVDLFDDGIAAQHAKARRALVQRKLDVADSANASVVLLGELLEILLDPEIPDQHVRQAVWQRATPEEPQLALELAAEIKRPLEDTHLQQLGNRYRAARDFAPRILATLRLRANPDCEQLLEAVEVLHDLNRRGVRRVPDDAPVGFVPRSWRPYVHSPDGAIDRHYWELCLLSELRAALRAGEIWVQGSRRYIDPSAS
jgi:hypothetical protein